MCRLVNLQVIYCRDVWKPNFGSVTVLKTRTKPKPKGQTRNFGFRGFSQNLTCLIQIVISQYLGHSHKALTFFALRTLSDSKWFFICTLNASKVILSADFTQFLSENRLYRCLIFGRFGFGSDIQYPNLNQISNIRTPLVYCLLSVYIVLYTICHMAVNIIFIA